MAALFARRRPRAKRTLQAGRLVALLPAFLWSLRTVAPGGSLRARAVQLLRVSDEGEVTRALMQARCERGAEIARLLGLGAGHGGGDPRARRALGRPRPARAGCAARRSRCGARILCLAQTVEIFHAARGLDAALRVARAPQRRLVRPARWSTRWSAIRGDARVLALAARRRRWRRGSRASGG